MKPEKVTDGICRGCGEWTDVTDSCCGDPVFIEGGWEYPEDYDDENEQETK
jgi:hypothetical protein